MCHPATINLTHRALSTGYRSEDKHTATRVSDCLCLIASSTVPFAISQHPPPSDSRCSKTAVAVVSVLVPVDGHPAVVSRVQQEFSVPSWSAGEGASRRLKAQEICELPWE